MHHPARRLVFGLVFLLAACAAPLRPGEAKVTVRRPVQPARSPRPKSRPRSSGRRTARALLCDRRSPQGLVRLDPATGKTSAPAQARAALGALAKAGAKMEILGLARRFRRGGRSGALYASRATCSSLDLVSGEAWRITETPDVEEKAPRLSPDGTKVAYVVKNDLWVCDLASAKTQQLTKRRIGHDPQRHAHVGLLGGDLRAAGRRVLVVARLDDDRVPAHRRIERAALHVRRLQARDARPSTCSAIRRLAARTQGHAGLRAGRARRAAEDHVGRPLEEALRVRLPRDVAAGRQARRGPDDDRAQTSLDLLFVDEERARRS